MLVDLHFTMVCVLLKMFLHLCLSLISLNITDGWLNNERLQVRVLPGSAGPHYILEKNY